MSDVFIRERQRRMDETLTALYNRGQELLGGLRALAADRGAALAKAQTMVAAGEYALADLLVFKTALQGTIDEARLVLNDLEVSLQDTVSGGTDTVSGGTDTVSGT